MGRAGVDFITIIVPDRIRYRTPTPNRSAASSSATSTGRRPGDAFTETYTGTLGPSVRAVVPIEDASGEVIALVSAGITVSTRRSRSAVASPR